MGSTASTLAASSSTIETNTINTTITTTRTYVEMEEMENTNDNSNPNELLVKIIEENNISAVEMNKSEESDTVDNNNKCENALMVNEKSKSVSGNTQLADDAWWWEIENENLILDQVTTPVAAAASASVASECHEVSFLNDKNPTNKLDRERVGNVIMSGKTDKQEDNAKVNNEIAECTENYGAVGGGNEKCDIVARETTLEEFKEELRLKRLARQTVVQDLRDEISSLRKQLAQQQQQQQQQQPQCSPENLGTPCRKLADCEKEEQIENKNDKKNGYYNGDNDGIDTDDDDPMSRSRHANIELANAQLALQLSTAENLTLRTELGVVKKQVVTLKEVISCCKQMLAVKEEQCTQVCI